MLRKLSSWYQLHVSFGQNIPSTASRLEYMDETVVGPHTKPSGAAGARLETEELANVYAEALGPIYLRRYGEGTELTVKRHEGKLTVHELANTQDRRAYKNRSRAYPYK